MLNGKNKQQTSEFLLLLPVVCYFKTIDCIELFLTDSGEGEKRTGPLRAVFALESSIGATVIIPLYQLCVLHGIVAFHLRYTIGDLWTISKEYEKGCHKMQVQMYYK